MIFHTRRKRQEFTSFRTSLATLILGVAGGKCTEGARSGIRIDNVWCQKYADVPSRAVCRQG